MLVGFRILPNVYEHYKASTSHYKVAPRTNIAHFFVDGGISRAPMVDKRPDPNTRYGNDAWIQGGISYVRPDGREFRLRMQLAR